MSEPRQYELIYVIAPDDDDAGVAELHTRVEGIVTAGGGQIDKTDNWGRRRLAYEIDRHREGTYVLELFTGSGAIVSELDRRLKVADNVLRYLIVRVDEDLRKAERARGRRQAKRQHRQSTRGESAAAPAAEASEASAPVEAAAPTEASGDQPGPAAEVSE
jgi:small subunit ribosomal protein S6